MADNQDEEVEMPDFFRIIYMLFVVRHYELTSTSYYYIYCEDVFTKKKYIVFMQDDELATTTIPYDDFNENIESYKYLINMRFIDYCIFYKPNSENQIFMPKYFEPVPNSKFQEECKVGGDDFIYLEKAYDRLSGERHDGFCVNGDSFIEVKEGKEKNRLMDIFIGWEKMVKNLNFVQTHLILTRRKNMRFMIELAYYYLPN